MSQKVSHEAVDWWVLNESGWPHDWKVSQRWEKWCAQPDHRVEYVGVMRFALDLRELPPPPLVSRRELLRDGTAGEGGFE